MIEILYWEIHDLNKGVGYWGRADGGEIDGSLIYNNGWSRPEVATGFQLVSPLASSVDLVSSSDMFAITEGAVNWELGDIASGQTRQVTLTVATTETGPLSNTATVASELAD
ncbi:hypothetical protein [Novipirellula sp.]|uniref:hypothetical protein n=1 Tax=Novipirellula sp. TaxID=2795430 RepID=UPI0035615144